MADTPTYLVNIGADCVTLRIEGRASYLNCAPVRKLFEKLITPENCHFRIDFEACSNMDSTFLGILASAALEVRKVCSDGQIELCRLSERNLELVNNLGLNRLMTIRGDEDDEVAECDQALEAPEETVSEKTILQAHECLIEADESNAQKFQDVVAFLKKQVEQD